MCSNELYETVRDYAKTKGVSVKYLVLADDYTGALDTGLQLRQQGLPTKVITCESGRAADYFSDSNVPVLVINTNTRHKTPEESYLIVRNICRIAVMNHIHLIYKKTDSVLRGNIGPEIEAVASVGYKKIYFVPAYPKLNRTTSGGRQFVDNIPIDKSHFGKDPFNPVKTSYIPDIISINPNRSVEVVPIQNSLQGFQARERVVVFDADTDERLSDIARWLIHEPKDYAIAGCAGFAEYLEPLLFCEKKGVTQKIQKHSGVLVISGSLHKLSFLQSEYAQRKGFEMMCVDELEGFSDNENFEATEEAILGILALYERSHKLIIKTAGTRAALDDSQDIFAAGEIIVNNFGQLVSRLFKKGFDGMLVVSGGDTLGGIMERMGKYSVEPIAEVEPGVVLASIDNETGSHQIITKSGGFGSLEIYEKIYLHVKKV